VDDFEPSDLYEEADDFCGKCGSRLDEDGQCPADPDYSPAGDDDSDEDE
jgi:hypothetical protein